MVLVSTLLALCGTLACKQEKPTIAAKDFPQRMALGYCEAVFSCQCDDYPYDNFNDCVLDLNSSYNELNDDAFIAGLMYDGTCPAQELDQVDALACKGYVPELPGGVCVAPCHAWHGSVGAGSICEVVASSAELGLAFSNCAQGLNCVAGVCVNPCQVNQLPGIGQPCPEMVCEQGAMCNAETMLCEAAPTLPGPAETCLNGMCDPDRAVCVVEANVCAALPATGQPCVQGQCDLNSYCGPDDVCVARPALACGLLGPGTPGDGDGDGDGDPTTGDGDGDPTGDGDGDPGLCSSMPLELPTYVTGSTSDGADLDSGSCGGGGPEVSYSFTAPVTGYFGFSLYGSDYDTIMYLRQGDCTGAEIICNDDGVEDTTSAFEVELIGGQDYTVFIDGYDGGGNYLLQIYQL